MDNKDFLKLFKKRKTTVIGITLVFVIIALLISLVQPLKYRSRSRLLILQPNTSADAYSVARSNEYVGGLISEIIYSGSFLESLKSSNAIFDRNYFSDTYKKNIKKWRKTVFARSGGDTGIIDIEIYHTNPEEAKRISLAVNQLIISGQSPYKFNTNTTKINVIDEPVVSSFPVKPNIPLNLMVSIIFGFIAGCSYIYLFPKERISEKIAKELFGENKKEETLVKPIINPTPVITNNVVYSSNPVPENLPIYGSYFEEEPEDFNNFPETFQFKGNISNVLGE